jgi:hypothetical protein
MQRKKLVSSLQRDIIVPLTNKVTSIFGITVDDIQVSTRAKFPRNKCMGMCSFGSFQITEIRPKFPTMVMSYLTKNTRNRDIFFSS